MSLSPGTLLGPYEILSPAGAGGMGEVYRARDTRLDRTVAIKVLPTEVIGDIAARQRMEREARSVAALQHPHICTLFDVGHQDGIDYLVMEFLDGETLAQRLSQGRLPLDQAIHYALQIADALAAAHKAGIVHRDLKPGNVMLTKAGAKLLDFGLAKPLAPFPGAASTQLATQSPLTGAGTLVGTLEYMAPEQLQGATADARSDVFAFGCVLYEMIAGRRAFPGDTPASVIAAVLEREPAPLATSGDQLVPPALDVIVRTCLAKNAEERWSSGHDLFLAVRRFGVADGTATAGVTSPSRSRRTLVPWMMVGLLLATTIAALYRSTRGRVAGPAGPAVQAVIEVPNAVVGGPKLSPDGRYVALRWLAEARFVVRRLADGETLGLPGTERASFLAWSPDSRSVAVQVDQDIKAIDIATGGIRSIARAPEDRFRAAWSGDDLLLGGTHLRRLSVSDGHVRDVYPADPDVSIQTSPVFLPDGRTFLFLQDSRNPDRRGVFRGSVDSSPLIRLLPDPASVAVSTRGYLFYGRNGSVIAQPFDVEHCRLAGEPVRIASGAGSVGWFTQFDVTGDTLLWANGTVTPPARLVWFDRNGRTLKEVGDIHPYTQLALSPDVQRVLTDEDGPGGGLFVNELARPIHSLVTNGEGQDVDAVWSPDAREIAYNCPGLGLCTRTLDQVGSKKLLTNSVVAVEEWTPDGRFILLGVTPTSISALPLTGEPKPIPVIESSSAVDEPHVSRDGRWLAYSAIDTGQWEVYVQPFMRPGGRVRVSTNGGSQARWRADGRELFYLALDGAMMSVDVANPLVPATPRKLFESRLLFSPVSDQYDVTADGQRFLMIVPQAPQASRFTVLTNWPSVLNGR